MNLKKYCISVAILIFTATTTADELITQEEKSDSKFTFAVMADTQAFRLQSGGNPNSDSMNGAEWRRINRNLVASLNKIPGVAFGIINGDITEFGRNDSWENVISIYFRLKFPFYIGLGNHDYANNVNDCWTAPESTWDGCAVNSIKKMESFPWLALLMVDVNSHFSMDWNKIGSYYKRGSLAYSWDYKGVHFVQLHNHPSYKVKLKGGFQTTTYDILPSITWLADDLRRARLRGVKDIIINFHQYGDQFAAQTDDYAKSQFRAIMQTYQPLAVFVGHYHEFNRDPSNYDWFGNTTVYTTSAAFRGQYHLVAYDNGKLTVTEVDGSSRQPKELASHTEPPKIHKPICKLTPQPGETGDIYMTTFMPSGIQWNLRQALASNNVLDAAQKGEAYMRPWNYKNPFQTWGFERVDGNSQAEYDSWYTIRHLKTGKVLDSNHDGKVYIGNPSTGNQHQQWRPIKTEYNSIMLMNRATRQFLDGSGDALYTNPGFEMFNPFKTWEINANWSESHKPENNRYFRAKHDQSWRFSIGEWDDDNWEYLDRHSLLREAPCIGW